MNVINATNRLISSEIGNLDRGGVGKLISTLNQSERKLLVKILTSNGGDDSNEALLAKIDVIQKQDIERFTYKPGNLFLNSLKKFIWACLGRIAYPFGILTFEKTHELIKPFFKSLAPKKEAPRNSTSFNTATNTQEGTAAIVATVNKSDEAQVEKKVISEKELSSLLSAERTRKPGEMIDLENLLKREGYSTEISGCSFTKESKIFKNVRLENISFNDCIFDFCHFSNTELKNVTFVFCKMRNSSFASSELENCQFYNCKIRETMFPGAELIGTVFNACSIISCDFEDTRIIDTKFDKVLMPATHFLEATIENSSILHSNLKNTVFFGTLDHFILDEASKETAIISAPVTAMLTPPELKGITTPKIYMNLGKRAKTVPLRISAEHQKVHPEKIKQEMENALKKVNVGDNEVPIPQKILHILENDSENNPESLKILRKAEKLASEVDAFVLPGGEDIPPGLYGEEQEEKTVWEGDYRRSILELSLIRQARDKGIPLMAVCRGFQMAMIFFGDRLVQDVPGHTVKIQKYAPINSDHKGIYAPFLENKLVSYCDHHQGIPVQAFPNEYLEPVIHYEGLVKAAEPKNSGAAPMLLLQFHPEMRKSGNDDSLSQLIGQTVLDVTMMKRNTIIWKILSDSAKTMRHRRQLIKEVRKKVLSE